MRAVFRALALSLIAFACGTAAALAQLPSADDSTSVSGLRAPPESLPSSLGHSLDSSTEPLDAASRDSAGIKEDSCTCDPDKVFALSSGESPVNFEPTFKLRGRVEAEAVMAVQSAASEAAIGDLQNGFGFRRVRLGAQGKIDGSSSWVSEVEVSSGNVRLRDVFVGLDAIPFIRQIRIGHFREPYSLEGMTSSNFMTFLERSPANVISPARNWGVCGYWWPDDERMLFSLGAFREGTASSGQSTGDGDNWAYTARLTGLPVYESEGTVFRLIHLGGAFSQRTPQNGFINFTPRTGSNLLTVEDNPGSPFLPDLDISASNYQLYNLQAASVYGPISFQAEWLAATVQRADAGLVFVHGAYGYASWFLTGEHRGYDRTRGAFDRIDVLRPLIRSEKERSPQKDPPHGFGAVELSARLAWFDFHSSNLPLDRNGAQVGTSLYELTLGVNWYLNSHTRIMLNYTGGMADKSEFDPVVAHIFGIRTALYW